MLTITKTATVEGAIDPAAKLRHVHVKGELLVLEPEHVVAVASLVQQVDPGAHVVRILAVGYELEVEASATVHTDAVGALELEQIDPSDYEFRDN